MPALYIVDPATEISLSSRHLEIRERLEGGKVSGIRRRIPLFDVDRVAMLTSTGVSASVFRGLLWRNIPVHLITRRGRLVGSFAPARDGDASVRIRQYRMADSPWALRLAVSVVRAKIHNSRRVLQKLLPSLKDQERVPGVNDAIQTLQRLSGRISTVSGLDELRGYEGTAAAVYFRELGAFFPPEMPFTSRSRRPPRDEVNALLSFTYTLVHSEVRTAVVAQGLDPCIGTLHAIDYGRPSLSLDLVEPFRAPLCDLFVLRLVNLRILGPNDFECDEETGGYTLTRGGMKRYLLQYERRMERLFKMPNSDEHTSFRKLFVKTARDYTRALQGGKDLLPFRMP